DGRFAGFVPDTTHYPGVYDAGQWTAAGRPAHGDVLALYGLNSPPPPIDVPDAMSWLDAHCRLANDERLVRDAGAVWKQRVLPGQPQPEWRIQMKRYACP